MVGRTAQHDAVGVLQVRFDLVEVGNAAIDGDCQVWAFGFQAVYAFVDQRRDIAVLFRREAPQPGLAGVDDEGLTASTRHDIDEGAQLVVIVVVVNAEPALDGDR